jgi:ABC-type dipeptide/oligopeptide/nickel transport system ATPase subunit
VSKSYNTLPFISQAEAIEQANEKIRKSMLDKHPGMRSRWPHLNKVVGGAFRFGETFYILGASGSGKETCFSE